MDRELAAAVGDGLVSLLLVISFSWTRLVAFSRERTRELRAERAASERYRRARAAELAAERDDNEQLRGHIHELRSLLAANGIPAPPLPARPRTTTPDPDDE